MRYLIASWLFRLAKKVDSTLVKYESTFPFVIVVECADERIAESAWACVEGTSEARGKFVFKGKLKGKF